jgi:hypothetical protein
MVQRRSSLPNMAMITLSGVLKCMIVIWLTFLIEDFGDASGLDNNWSKTMASFYKNGEDRSSW